MTRPTLEEQLTLANMSDEEVEELFMPHGLGERIGVWAYKHLHPLHHPYWSGVNWVQPYDLDTHARHWRWRR